MTSPFISCLTAQPARWITEQVAPVPGKVTSLVPYGYDAYVRLLHPFQGPDDSDLSWRELATRGHRPLQALTSSRDLLADVPDGRPLRHQDAEPPTPGWIPTGVATVLSDLLGPHTTTPERCYFAIWDGRAGFRPAEGHGAAFDTPGRRWYLYTAPLTAAVEGFQDESGLFGIPPNYWWPADQAWCVATEVDHACTYLGCSRSTATDIARSTLETFSVEPNDPAYD